MDQITTTNLNHEAHLLLDQPLLRLPNELNRKVFKTTQRLIETESKQIPALLQNATKASMSSAASADATLSNLDTMLQRMQTLKRKLSTLQVEDADLHRATSRRIQHVQDLYDIPSLADVKYDEWSRIRLDRLLVDYMLRQGYTESARQLAREKGIEDLVDVEAFVQCSRIERSLRAGEVKEALTWCGVNGKDLRKMGINLEFELRLQQYIELVRTRKLAEATHHGRKYLGPHTDAKLVEHAAGLLIHEPDTHVEPYRSLYSANRWTYLATQFVQTYQKLFSLPPRPLLHIALSAGLSALKTPSCHSAFQSSTSNSTAASVTVCPICSTELNELARNVPYAHHSQSYVQNDPVVLPNGRIYGREWLMRWNEKIGTAEGRFRDPMDIEQEWGEEDVKKVFMI